MIIMDGNNDGDRLANDTALEMGAVILIQFAQIAAALLFDMEEEGLGDGHGKKKMTISVKTRIRGS